MYKQGLVLAFTGIITGCATPQTETAKEEVCVTQTEETTGSRVETHTECRPAEPSD